MTELSTKVMRETNLISRCFGVRILSAARKNSVPLTEIWSAMQESALLDEYLLFTELRLSRGNSFLVALMRYLREQNDSVNEGTIIATIGNGRRWVGLALGISDDKLQRNVQLKYVAVPAVIAKALAPGLKTMPSTSAVPERDTLVVCETSNVAMSVAPSGTVAGVQLAAVFQAPLSGLNSTLRYRHS